MTQYIIQFNTNMNNWNEDLIFSLEEAQEYLNIKGFKKESGRYIKPESPWGSATYAYLQPVTQYSQLFSKLLKSNLEPDMELKFDSTIDAYFAEDEEIRLLYTPPHRGTDNKHRILIFTWGDDELYEVLIPDFSFLDEFMQDFNYLRKNRFEITNLWTTDMPFGEYREKFKLGKYMI